MAELAIITPTLGRSQKLGPLLENIATTTPPIWRMYFVVDSDDDDTWETVGRLACEEINMLAVEHNGTLAVKANAAVRASREPWMLSAGDDVLFHPGWYEAAMAVAEGAGVIGTNDLHNPATVRGSYATQILAARSYIEQHGGPVDAPGDFLPECYHHNCVDVEVCEVAQARGVYAHAHDSVIEHLHPLWGKGEVDDTYRRGGFARVNEDEALLIERRKLWQPVAA